MSDRHHERAIAFDCAGKQLFGILSGGATDVTDRRALLIVCGGGTARIGSSRQNVQLARAVAASGTPVLRFDARGKGDSEGEFADFSGISDDIRSAVDALFRELPRLREVVLLGLCDAATASICHAHRDGRISAVVMINPWITTCDGAARTYMKSYYLTRLTNKAFWRKLRSGKVDIVDSLKGFALQLRETWREHRQQPGQDSDTTSAAATPPAASLPVQMLSACARFDGHVLYVLGLQDMTAVEFRDALMRAEPEAMPDSGNRRSLQVLKEADHTFSMKPWREQLERWTVAWLATLPFEAGHGAVPGNESGDDEHAAVRPGVA